ncbi:MAG: 16S rRNA (guanine(527)-N(7))-methyltransferase RsmG [Sphingomonas bacterium]|nr:16S rRNA (guanine(527)-N(7))-methyltransferase RsmG [Sphingomonas bacterium]
MTEAILALPGLDVPRETFERLEHFARLLVDENARQNLVSQSTLPDLWQRHIADAAQLLAFAPGRGSWLDIGSGAGLPGMVIAILTGAPMLLVEPRRLRAEFLQRTVEALQLSHNVKVERAKVELVRHPPVDVITARAVASIDRLFCIAAHLSHKGTIWVLPKGRSAKSELDEARRTWQGEFRLEPSRTDPNALILIASRVRRRSAARGVA